MLVFRYGSWAENWEGRRGGWTKGGQVKEPGSVSKNLQVGWDCKVVESHLLPRGDRTGVDLPRLPVELRMVRVEWTGVEIMVDSNSL